ncbi:enoyl-CoA hydratase/isomerase family protein [Nocardioides sp. YIM 152315]|uniref:enoyl-CoA hydratase/isomerase family protein n=1 Tax=Nocardioides sp. YIM 152315 TaxID=3031760 RepID=UPI0023DC5B03|nr:enoyl-CoA hydratase/isomerase family protein [Nocardioides sp. YIM 152315]MDF1602251.1 enoyl-CoA hydratase/isomerase family protein [Nocardioides sp. YIM 152315]
MVERDGDTLRIALSRPERHNAFSRAMRDGLIDALELAAWDPSVGSIILNGRGPSFSSGGDLDEFGTIADVATAHGVRMARSAALAMHRVSDRVEVRTHGAVIGAGVEISAFAARVLGDETSWFSLPELSMGLVPGAGGTVSVPRRIGRWRTAWLVLSGERLDLTTALEWGLVDGHA